MPNKGVLALDIVNSKPWIIRAVLIRQYLPDINQLPLIIHALLAPINCMIKINKELGLEMCTNYSE
jgi:hypothetical protein